AGHGAIRRWWTIQLSPLTSPSGPEGPGRLDRMAQLAFRPRRHPPAPGKLRPARGGTKGGTKGGPDLTEAMGSGTFRRCGRRSPSPRCVAGLLPWFPMLTAMTEPELDLITGATATEIADSVERAVRADRLRPGDRLPPLRPLRPPPRGAPPP